MKTEHVSVGAGPYLMRRFGIFLGLLYNTPVKNLVKYSGIVLQYI